MAAEEASWGEEEYSIGDGAAQAQHSDQQVENFAPHSHASGDAADSGSDDDGGDYDPESVLLEPSNPVPSNKPPPPSSSPNPAQQRPVSKPKVSGGFLVEVSDEEDDDEEDEESGDTPEDTPRPASTAQAQEAAKEPPKPEAATNPAPPADAPPAFGGLDPVALLEARTREDPRGDMDAWLNLIANHKRTNNLEALRGAYNRFVEEFPQAVSRASPPSL